MPLNKMNLLTTSQMVNLATILNKDEFRLNQNIVIAKVYGRQRCCWCHSFIENDDWCFVLYDVGISQKKNFMKKGGGVYVHLDCVEGLGRKLNWFKEVNIRKIIINKLK